MTHDPRPRIVQRGLYAEELQIGVVYAHRPGRTDRKSVV